MKHLKVILILFFGIWNYISSEAQSYFNKNELEKASVFVVLPTIDKKIKVLAQEVQTTKQAKRLKRLEKILISSKKENETLQKNIANAAKKYFLIQDFGFIYDTSIQYFNKNRAKIAIFDKNMQSKELKLVENKNIFLIQYRKLNFETSTGIDGISFGKLIDNKVEVIKETGIKPLSKYLNGEEKAFEKAFLKLNKTLGKQ